MKSSDPRIGDRVLIRDGVLDEVTGVIRNVFSDLVISVILDERTMTKEQIASLVRSPETLGIHWLVEAGAYELFDRKLMT